MSTRLLHDTPHDYWDPTKPPSPGQYQALAEVALNLLGIDTPPHRLKASEILARLRIAQEELPTVDRPTLPEPW